MQKNNLVLPNGGGGFTRKEGFEEKIYGFKK